MKGAVLSHRRAVAGVELGVERTGIRFWNVTPERVRIEIEVENRGDTWSEPTPLRVQAAPFGAFVPWKPRAALTVPPIAPRGVAVVRTEARRSISLPLGDFSDLVPPARTARGTGDPGGNRSARLRLLRNPVARLMTALAAGSGRSLPADLFEVLGRPNVHWAGNINVLIGRRAVERHMAQALRIYPGRTNMAVFMLGGNPRGYVMRVDGDAVAWEHDLLDQRTGSLRGRDGTFLIEGGPRNGPDMVFFACRPPQGCERGSAEVHVQELPSGREAVVEFSLDANAAGPGCYTI